ncbi:TonB-dependent vitamin B12 receptor [Denitratisoma sp. DHT3]|uniref:TonB-dependent vitamin B12 receptor n=1 Tax=Denitratisoma sp. DHT3 TaxID=1981880 RepID=UPI00119886C0|nr:TonB-dependent vitamin B12 receptor [Denitratisoma sp. DHT3]QDX81752.1 TonB-dependent vitamin B12 receptor [Denitratisoma sp. DHT3]
MKSRFLPAALLLGSPFVLAAESAAVVDAGAVVVTATRTARPAETELLPVTVIDRAEIERSQAVSVQDLLRFQPGIAIANAGGQGKVTSLFLRGANADHVLVLLDGVKLGSASTGTAALQDLPLEMIERIEIVRGARSSLYGSEALGGVIQIFTRKGGRDARPALSLGAGSHGTWQGAASLAGNFGAAGWYSLGAATFETAGLNACKGSRSAGCFVAEPDRDGYRNQSGRLRFGWRFDNGAEAEVNWLRAESRNKYDGSSVNAAQSVQQALGASLGVAPLAGWRATLRLGQSRDAADNFKDALFKSRFNTRRDTVNWQNEIALAPGQQLVAGVDWQRDRLESTTRYAVGSRDNAGVFAQYLAEAGGHDWQLSARRDDSEQFGAKTTGALAWGHALTRDLRLTASHGTAFKAPTFNQLYYPGFGNPQLRPEEARSLGLGLAGTLPAGRWSVNAFETRIDRLIGFDSRFTPVNIDAARLRGGEATASWRGRDWELRGTLSLLDPENLGAGANHGKTLPRRARQSFLLSADREAGAWRWGADLRGEGHRYDDLANTVRLGGYATVDLRAEYRIDPVWRLQARIENLLDRGYETAYLYNQPGRGLYLTLRYQP